MIKNGHQCLKLLQAVRLYHIYTCFINWDYYKKKRRPQFLYQINLINNKKHALINNKR